MDAQSLEQLAAVERSPEVLSGAWRFWGTRVPVAALFENLRDGATIDEFLSWFPGVTRERVEALLDDAVHVLQHAAWWNDLGRSG